MWIAFCFLLLLNCISTCTVHSSSYSMKGWSPHSSYLGPRQNISESRPVQQGGRERWNERILMMLAILRQRSQGLFLSPVRSRSHKQACDVIYLPPNSLLRLPLLHPFLCCSNIQIWFLVNVFKLWLQTRHG